MTTKRHYKMLLCVDKGLSIENNVFVKKVVIKNRQTSS